MSEGFNTCKILGWLNCFYIFHGKYYRKQFRALSDFSLWLNAMCIKKTFDLILLEDKSVFSNIFIDYAKVKFFDIDRKVWVKLHE